MSLMEPLSQRDLLLDLCREECLRTSQPEISQSDENNKSAYVKKIQNKKYSKNLPGADVCLTEPDLRDASRGP